MTGFYQKENNMKLTALSLALITALGISGCGTQGGKQSYMTSPVVADAEAQYALGRFYQGQQRYELAIEAYRKALAASPAHVSAHNGLGASLLLLGQNAQAIEQFKQGLTHQPRSAALWNNLGYAYMLSGETRLAEIALKQSLDLDPADSRTNTNLAMVKEGAASQTAALPQTQTVPVAAAPLVAVPVVAAVSAPAPGQVTPPSAVVESVKVVAVAPIEAMPVQAAALPGVVHSPAMEQTVSSLKVVETAPRVYELSMPETTVSSTAIINVAAATTVTVLPVKTNQVTRISVPLRNEMVEVATTPEIAASLNKALADVPVPTEATAQPEQAPAAQTAALNNEDFVLEIRNGNGIRRMAWRTSQYLAYQGYSTKRLTNQPGFNVVTTRIFYLPGYLAEAERLLVHLPKSTTLSESMDLRRGTHVRVVLGRDMLQSPVGLVQVMPVYVAALTR